MERVKTANSELKIPTDRQEALKLFGLDRNATQEDIKMAYKRVALRYRDEMLGQGTNEKSETAQAINVANDLLENYDPTKPDEVEITRQYEEPIQYYNKLSVFDFIDALKNERRDRQVAIATVPVGVAGGLGSIYFRDKSVDFDPRIAGTLMIAAVLGAIYARTTNPK